MQVTLSKDREHRRLPFESLVGYNMRRAYGVQLQRFKSAFAPYNIRPVQLSILALILERPGLNQSELGRLLDIKRANIATLLDELEQRQLITRSVSETDRRVHLLQLTPTGQSLVPTLLERHERLEKDLNASLGADAHAQLLELLKKVRQVNPEPDLD